MDNFDTFYSRSAVCSDEKIIVMREWQMKRFVQECFHEVLTQANLDNSTAGKAVSEGDDGMALIRRRVVIGYNDDGTEIFKRIQILRDMGVGLSVDDFGTGFSGLSRLVSLPVTEIKIDKSFVDRCLTEKRILALLEAITSIGQSLNLTVVAEGVETKEQFEMLRKIHCRVIQGYFFSRPLPAEEIPGWMSSVLPLKI